MENRNLIRLDPSEWSSFISLLESSGTDTSLALIVKINEARKITLTEKAYITAAKGESDDESECDNDAIVAPGEDRGAFVQVWSWVPASAANVF